MAMKCYQACVTLNKLVLDIRFWLMVKLNVLMLVQLKDITQTVQEELVRNVIQVARPALHQKIVRNAFLARIISITQSSLALARAHALKELIQHQRKIILLYISVWIVIQDVYY